MKKIFRFLLVIFALNSCSDNEERYSSSDLVGKWKLVEVLADPGDGSGVFVTLESNKTLEFYKNGRVMSNGQLCNMFLTTGQESSGKYFPKETTIRPNDCDRDNVEILYQIENSELILRYFCIEACAQKYRKVN